MICETPGLTLANNHIKLEVDHGLVDQVMLHPCTNTLSGLLCVVDLLGQGNTHG